MRDWKPWLRREVDVILTHHAEKRINEMEIPLQALVALAKHPSLRYVSRSKDGHEGFVQFNNDWPRWALITKPDGDQTVILSAVFREQDQYVRDGVTYQVGA